MWDEGIANIKHSKPELSCTGLLDLILHMNCKYNKGLLNKSISLQHKLALLRTELSHKYREVFFFSYFKLKC